MTLMWILMAIAHSANACYCDIKSLLMKKWIGENFGLG
jgi:hypothetical protein